MTDVQSTMDDNSEKHGDRDDDLATSGADHESPRVIARTKLDVPSPGAASPTNGEGRRGEPDEWKCKFLELEEEVQQLRPLVKENKRLRRCVGGVTVIGRALTKAKSELTELGQMLAQVQGTDVTSMDARACGDATTVNGGASSLEESQEETYNANMEISLPPQDTDDSSQHLVELSDGFLEVPLASKHGLSKEESRPVELEESKDDQGKPEDTADQKPAESENSDQGCKTAGAADSPSEEVQAEKQAEAPERTEEDRAAQPDARQQPATGSKTVPKTEAKTGDDDEFGIEDAELATAEAMLTELAIDVIPLTGGTTLGRDDVRVRSVATLTEDMGRFASQTVSRKLEEAILQMQVQELKKVNRDWKSYCEEKQQEFLAEKRKFESQLDDANIEATKRADQYDQMLLTAKGRIDESQENCKELKAELEQERLRNDKLDKLNRNLAKQTQSLTREVKGLKEALERKHNMSWKTYSPMPYRPDVSYKNNLEVPTPVQPVRDATEPHHKASDESKRPRSPPTRTASAPLPLVSPTDEEAGVGAGLVRPKSPPDRSVANRARGHGEAVAAPDEFLQKYLQANAEAEKSLSKEQLKEQVMLFRQQHELFESDFKKEQSDKNKAISKLNTLRREVERQRNQEMKIKPKIREAPIGHARGLPRQPVVNTWPRTRTSSPPNQISQHKASRRIQHQPVAAPVGPTGTGPKDVTVVKYGDNTTFRLVGKSAAVIMPTEYEGVRLLNIQLGGQSEDTGRERSLEPFKCPRCQRLFRGCEWESYEHHVTLCNM